MLTETPHNLRKRGFLHNYFLELTNHTISAFYVPAVNLFFDLEKALFSLEFFKRPC